MSTERRVLRPYRGLRELERLFETVLLRWGTDAHEPGHRSVRTREFIEEPVDLVLPDGFREKLVDALVPTGVPLDSARFVVVGTSSRLKLAALLHSSGLGEVPNEIRLAETTDRPSVFTTPFSGVTVTAAVVTAQALPAESLRPHRAGTWLARAVFEVKTDVGDFGFTPKALTDKDRQDFGLPMEAVRYFKCEGVLLPDRSDESLEVFVDQELLYVLDDQARTPVGRILQQELFVDAMRAVIAAVGREWDDGTTVGSVDGSLGQRLAQLMAGETKPGPGTAAALKQMRQEPDVAAARAESLVPGYQKALVGALTG